MPSSRTSSRLYGAVSIPYRLDNPESFRALIDVWGRFAPGLVPQRGGVDEPVRRPFDPADPDSALSDWTQGSWIARRTRPTVSAVFQTRYGHSTAMFEVADVAGAVVALQRLIEALADAFDADFGMVHRLLRAEVAEARAARRTDVITVNRVTGSTSMLVGYTRQLLAGLPTLYWKTVLGPPYLELFGEPRARATPVFSVIGARRLALTVSPDPPGDDNWDAFRSIRDAAIEHLGRAAFFPTGTWVPESFGRLDPLPWTPSTAPRTG